MPPAAARAREAPAAPAPARPSSAEPRRAAAAAPAAGGVPFVPLHASAASREAGVPLALPVRASLERSLGVDLGAVRVHAGPAAASLTGSAGARAFALGTHVYLGAGENAGDLSLMGHEVAHVLQQRGGASLQRRTASAAGPGEGLEREADAVSAAVVAGHRATVTGQAPLQPQFSVGGWIRRRASAVGGAIARGASAVGSTLASGARAVAGAVGDLLGAALRYVRDHARAIPGYDMLALILGRDPLTQQAVERNAVNLLRAFMGLWPGGSMIFEALQRYGILERVGGWLRQQLATLGLAAAALRDALDRFLHGLGPESLLDLAGVFSRARRIFTEPIERARAFIRGLVDGVLTFIREAVLRPLAVLASRTRGYDLLKAVLGHDPLTGQPYPRTAENLIGGFMRLIGQEEKWRYVQESRAIPRVWAWFQQQLAILLGFVRQVPQLFLAAIRSFRIGDLLNLPGALARMGAIFGGFVGRFITWAGQAALQVMMFIFEVLAPGAMPVLRRAAAVLRIIVAEPVRFVGNLVRAGLRGFEQFRDHIRTHLINGLVGWLTGALTGAGLTLPERWDFRGILSLVLQILGLTWQNIRRKLLRHIPERVLSALETTFDVLVTLVRDGPIAAWARIREHLANLQETIFGAIRDWVIRTVVMQAVIRIASMLNPAGAVIQAIIAIYNTIMFFRERLQQIIQVAESFFSSIAQIAAGAIGAAADRVEQTMGRLVPVVISFLARLLGLGGISNTIRNIIARIRAPIDRALDRVVDWIAAQARRLGGAIARGARAVAGRITRWWAARKTFRAADGQTHSLLFTGEGRGAVLKVRSDEMPFSQWIARATTGRDADRIRAKREAARIAGLIDRERSTEPAGADEAAERARAARATRVNGLLEQLAPHANLLFGRLIPVSFPGEVNRPQDSHTRFGTGMSIKPLTNRQRAPGTPPTSASNPTYAALNERRESPGGASFYIKGHLLNQQLGGKGDWKNLVPLSRAGNAQHERRAESVVKRAVDAGGIVEYDVAPTPASRGDKADLLRRIDASREAAEAKRTRRAIVEAEDHVPGGLTIRAYLLDESLQHVSTILDATVANPVGRSIDGYHLSSSPRPEPVDLSADTADVIATVPGIGLVLAQRIVAGRLGGRYSTYEQLAERVPGVGPERLRALEEAGQVRLFSRARAP